MSRAIAESVWTLSEPSKQLLPLLFSLLLLVVLVLGLLWCWWWCRDRRRIYLTTSSTNYHPFCLEWGSVIRYCDREMEA